MKRKPTKQRDMLRFYTDMGTIQQIRAIHEDVGTKLQAGPTIERIFKIGLAMVTDKSPSPALPLDLIEMRSAMGLKTQAAAKPIAEKELAAEVRRLAEAIDRMQK